MKIYYRFFSVLILGLMISTCSKDGGDLSSLDVFIPDFSNAWTVIKGNADGFFFLNSTVTDSAKGKGTIEGRDDESSGSELLISGTFTGVKVNLTISSDSLNSGTPPLADSTYNGIYDTLANPHLLRMINTSPPHDSLVLKRS
ncbi:MAG: hypothetical protein ACHQET_04295 [Chitinophagales bacterium]